MIQRDKYEQFAGEWTDREYRLLAILEEVCSSDEDNEDRTLSAYMADIMEGFGE